MSLSHHFGSVVNTSKSRYLLYCSAVSHNYILYFSILAASRKACADQQGMAKRCKKRLEQYLLKFHIQFSSQQLDS